MIQVHVCAGTRDENWSYILLYIQAIHQLRDEKCFHFSSVMDPHTNPHSNTHLTALQKYKFLVRKKRSAPWTKSLDKTNITQVPLFCSFTLPFISSLFSPLTYYSHSRILWIIKKLITCDIFLYTPIYLQVQINVFNYSKYFNEDWKIMMNLDRDGIITKVYHQNWLYTVRSVY